jgi:uncharacterized membrane protein
VSKPTPAQLRFLTALSKGENYRLTRQMEAACLIAGWIIRKPLIVDGVTYYPARLTAAGWVVLGLPVLEAEVIIGGFRHKIADLSQSELLTLIAALQTLVK